MKKTKIVYQVQNTEGAWWWTMKKPDNYYEKETARRTLDAFAREDHKKEDYQRVLIELTK